MKETSIYPGCKLEDVHDVLIALSIRFGEHVYAYFNGYYVNSAMSKDEIINGYREHWSKSTELADSEIGCTFAS